MTPKKKDDMRAKVEEPRRAEANAKAAQIVKKTHAEKKSKIPDEGLIVSINENKVGDAKLHCRLHRGSVVYVKNWYRFLVWGGRHWIEDDYDIAYQGMEDISELYLRLAENKQKEADVTNDKV